MNYKQIDKLIFKYILVITGLIILFIKLDTVLAVLTTIIKSFSNIFFAAMLAYVVNIIMSRIEKLLEKTKHPTIIKLKEL